MMERSERAVCRRLFWGMQALDPSVRRGGPPASVKHRRQRAPRDFYRKPRQSCRGESKSASIPSASAIGACSNTSSRSTTRPPAIAGATTSALPTARRSTTDEGQRQTALETIADVDADCGPARWSPKWNPPATLDAEPEHRDSPRTLPGG